MTQRSDGAFAAALRRIYGSPDEGALALHLRGTYGVGVDALAPLDRNVFRVERRDGSRWVARVFAPQRGVERAAGDAEVLRLLEHVGFPAERCADAEPVSTFQDRSVLVTGLVEGHAAAADPPAAHALGALLGRLHTLPEKRGAFSRAAGALHHWSVTDGTPREDLAAAAEWLADVDERVPAASRETYASLREQVDAADDCSGLPRALVHPDFIPKNAIVSPGSGHVMIDWTGSGTGPRVASLAVLLFSIGLRDKTALEAAVAGYRTHLTLETDELDRLGAAMLIRPLVFAAFQYCLAVATGATPTGAEGWWHDRALIGRMASMARNAFER